MSDITDVPTLIYQIIQKVRAHDPYKPALIGVGGAQGSGKSTVCWLLEAANRGRFAHFSLDDVYFARAEREIMATGINPLLLTRGPPGTHDPGVLYATLASLLHADNATRTPLPRFDKARDDRAPRETWPIFIGRPKAILIDGWLLGAKALDLAAPPPPINSLESEPHAAQWLEITRTMLATSEYCMAAPFDALIYLQAPSWEIVRVWRGQQEEETLGRALTTEENAALDRFVMHYERITRSMLAGHHSAKWIVHLDEARKVTRIEERS